MGHSFDPRSHSMSRCSILVGGYIRMLSARCPAAVPAAADMKLEQSDFRFRRRRHIRHRCFFRLLGVQGPTTEGAAGFLDGDIHRRSTAGGRFRAARERSLPWLASRPLRVLLSLTLGERCCAALILTLEILDLLAQLLVLPVQIKDQTNQILSVEGVQIRHKTLLSDFALRSIALKSGYTLGSRLPLINYAEPLYIPWHLRRP